MKKELEIWQFIAGRLKRKQNAVLLLVAESAGSSPGRQGFKMAIGDDGLLCGSIGGGLMEVNLVELAREILEGEGQKAKGETAKGETASENPNHSAFRVPRSAIVEQVHQKNSPNRSGMICSGRQTVIFFKLNAQHLKTVREIARAIKTHQSKTLQISDSRFQIAENEPDKPDFRFERAGENSFLFEEKLGFKNRLFIVGGGHCALALSELASKMDFHIALFDDRPFLNTLAKNKFVHEKKIIESYERIGEFIPSGANIYVVVMTLGYKSDAAVIRRLFDRDFKYFGVLGSGAKMKTLLKNLRREGFSPAKLDRIRTPVGLPINSRTPEEIAVSIAAEIIAVKNAKN